MNPCSQAYIQQAAESVLYLYIKSGLIFFKQAFSDFEQEASFKQTPHRQKNKNKNKNKGTGGWKQPRTSITVNADNDGKMAFKETTQLETNDNEQSADLFQPIRKQCPQSTGHDMRSSKTQTHHSCIRLSHLHSRGFDHNAVWREYSENCYTATHPLNRVA